MNPDKSKLTGFFQIGKRKLMGPFELQNNFLIKLPLCKFIGSLLILSQKGSLFVNNENRKGVMHHWSVVI
jgi:hypothetical protein